MHTVLDAPQAPAPTPVASSAGLHVLVSPDEYEVFERARQLLAPAGISLITASAAQAQSTSAFEAMRLREVEGQLVRTAMQKAKGNVSRAARALGLSRSALYRRLERHGLTTAGELIR